MITSTLLALTVALALALTALVANTKLVISTSDFLLLDHRCTNISLQTDISYTTNLNTVLSDLVSNANKSTSNGYFATNTSALGRGLNHSEIIYACYLCRGDIPSSECSACVSTAVVETTCPLGNSTVTWYDKCLVRYSTVPFSGIVNEFYYTPWQSPDNVTSDVKSYTAVAGDTLQGLASLLGSSLTSSLLGGKKYYRIQIAPVKDSFLKLYTMAQCTPDLAPSDCQKCLQVLIIEIPNFCNNRKGCRMVNPSCMVRYDGYNFYESLVALTPTPSPLAPSSGSNNFTTPTGTRDTSHVSLVLKVAVGCLSLLLLIFVVAFIALLFRKGRTGNNAANRNINMHAIGASQSPNSDNGYVTTVESLQYDLATIEAATNNFSDVNKIGEGGFGSVYKGVLPNGIEIAVKRLSKGSRQGLEQFKNEVVLVAKLQHRNLVKLLGFCLTSNEMLLVYEFVRNKSLDLILFDSNKGRHLTWSVRYKIINGIARGLSYLHEDSRLKIIHRDLKASNILLDADMNPKIADFGLARKFSKNQEQEHTERLAGTMGYMAPEYLEYGEISTKSDVYSFGGLVLEIVSGKKIRNRQAGLAKNLLTYAWKHWNENTVSTFIDASMEEGSYYSDQVARCVQVGLLCVQEDAEQRPSMIKVVSYFNGNVDLPAPQRPTYETSFQSGSSTGTGDLQSNQSQNTKESTSARTVSQSNQSTGRSSQSFPALD